jgi:hypothetical protein
MAYTHKVVNGVRLVLTAGDQTVLAARDAEDWTPGPSGDAVVMTSGTPAERFARMLKAHRLTLAEFRTTLGI